MIDAKDELRKEFEAILINEYGPLVFSEGLCKVFGFCSDYALSRAEKSGKLPIRLHTFKHKKGKAAFAKDIAIWLAEERINYLNSESQQ